jgi:hypothetical protein
MSQVRWMMRGMLLAVAAIGISSGAALADEKKPEVAGPKPGPEVEKLGYFVGAWTSTGYIKASPASEGGDTAGRDACRWMPGKFFVGCMMMSESPMGRIQTEGIMGYDTEKKTYTWSSFDSTGRHETATGKFEGGVWTWSGETKMGQKLVKSRYVVTDTTPEGYTFRWETSSDGKNWNGMMQGKATKMAARPTPGAMPMQAPPSE